MIRREKEKTRTGVDDMEDIDEHVEKVEPLTLFDKDSLIDINLEDDPWVRAHIVVDLWC